MSASVKNVGSEHFAMAAKHLQVAAKRHLDAAKSFDAGNDEKGGFHAFVGMGQLELANWHIKEASKVNAKEHC